MIDWSFLKEPLERQAKALERIAAAVELHPDIKFQRDLLASEQVVTSPQTHIIAKERAYYRIAELAGAALAIDGDWHKQWFLEEIYKQLGLDPASIPHEAGVAP